VALVALPAGIPGIRAPLTAYPDTAGPILAVAQAALRGPSSLSEAERELLATAVSVENQCWFCARSHGAAARVLLGSDAAWVDDVLDGRTPAGVPAKLAALVDLARAVARSCHGATPDVEAACRRAGATDRDLHDTVLVAAAFSLFNRYVDGLGAPEPSDPAAYVPMGERLARSGYR
jgi:uncharacterized peroxidase-related enzyme